MVILVLTREGYQDVEPLIAQKRCAVWLNHDVLDAGTVGELRRSGAQLTTFSCPVDPADEEAVADALAIITEHHPGDRIWVEVVPSPS